MNSFERKISIGFILKFTLPSIIMMVFNSFYVMVDGVFVSKFVGTDALSAVNLVFPVLSLIFAIGIMLASGASAVVSKQMGERDTIKANESFTLIAALGTILGIIISLIVLLFTREIVYMLGANDNIYNHCYDYAFYLSFFLPFSILQILFQFLFSTAGKPNLGLLSTLLGGFSNIILDYLLIYVFGMGIKGAAIATGIGFLIPSIIGIVYFSVKQNSNLRFIKPRFNLKTIADTCLNGSSEMVSNLSVSLTTLLFNILMMQYLGEDGVAALTIVLYAQFFFTAIFFGYIAGISPIIGYNYGAKNKSQLKLIFNRSVIFVCICSVGAYLMSIILSGSIIGIFAETESSVFDYASKGMSLFSIGFLFMGLNIFASGLFTALSNGKISAILSFLRTFIFIFLAIIILPLIFEVNGIWLAIPLAEFLALIVSVFYMLKMKNVYEY